ncbi:WYL domain-containing protein [Paenibacillus sp. MSJ-34]|uniref:WYL domain-containing protein n=1 Tax=Paenibacillus sp. MSJ-34 TaxID=2841529 RepID=UPI00345F45C1
MDRPICGNCGNRGKSREDWILVELYFEWEDEAKGFILGFADQINVIEPKHLRMEIRRWRACTGKFR